MRGHALPQQSDTPTLVQKIDLCSAHVFVYTYRDFTVQRKALEDMIIKMGYVMLKVYTAVLSPRVPCATL